MRVLIVDDHIGIRELLDEMVTDFGHDSITAETGNEVLAMCQNKDYDLVLLDLYMPGMDGIEVLQELKKLNQNCEVIIITAYGSVPSAVEALRLGAYGYIRKPFEPADIQNTIARVSEVIGLRRAYEIISRERLKPYHIDGLVYLSSKQKKLRKKPTSILRNKDSILITGELGVGKLFLTKIIHFNSPSSESTLIRLSPIDIVKWLDSGTFIHPDGIILNKDQLCKSLIDQGCETIVFQRLSNLESDYQLELLKLLKELSIGMQSSSADCDLRVIATVQLEEKTKSRHLPIEVNLRKYFKQILQISPLRDRREDTIPLAQMFLFNVAGSTGEAQKQLSKQVQEYFEIYNWPNNVKELKHLIRACRYNHHRKANFD